MAEHKYSFEKYKPDTMSKAVGRSLSVSTKHCIEISNHLRGKKLSRAKKILQQTVNKERAIPFKRFSDDVGHKKGPYSAARYPVKAASTVLKLLQSCEANAQNKGLNTEDMAIVHMNAHRGSQQFKPGRHRRRLMKNTHLEIVLEEVSKKEDKKRPAAKKSNAEKKEGQESGSSGEQANEEATSETTQTTKSNTKSTTKKSTKKSTKSSTEATGTETQESKNKSDGKK